MLEDELPGILSGITFSTILQKKPTSFLIVLRIQMRKRNPFEIYSDYTAV